MSSALLEVQKPAQSIKAIHLQRGEFYVTDLQQNERVHLTIEAGKAWITMEGDDHDYVSIDGEELTFSRPGRLVVEGLRITTLSCQRVLPCLSAHQAAAA